MMMNEPRLTPPAARAVDALVEARFDVQRVPASERDRAQRVLGVMRHACGFDAEAESDSSAESEETEPASQTDPLVNRTLALIRRHEAESPAATASIASFRAAESEEEDAFGPDESARWRTLPAFRVPDLVAMAASFVLLIG